MLLRIHSQNPEKRKIDEVISCLKSGGIIVYPTDTIYGLGCDINNSKAIERICRIKQIKPEKANMSFICYDLSNISEYTANINTSTFKILKRALPGPFTFILKANSNVPKLLKNKKKTIGIRVPDNLIACTIVKELGNPILSTSLNHDDEILEYMTDPEEIYERYHKLVDIVIDGGYGDNQASTVISLENDIAEILREGKGDVNSIL